MTVSSRTPEGAPGQCPLCQAEIRLEPSLPAGDAACPRCGKLLWFHKNGAETRTYVVEQVQEVRERLKDLICEHLHLKKEQMGDDVSFEELGADSLDMVELLMGVEEQLKVAVPDEQAEKLKTFGDLLDYILQHRPG